MSNLKFVTESTFSQEVLGAKKPVLVDFFAEWCGPCKFIAPILEQIAQERPEVEVVKVDVDSEQNLAMQYNVSSIPTLMLFKNGEVVQSVVGAVGKAQLLKLIES